MYTTPFDAAVGTCLHERLIRGVDGRGCTCGVEAGVHVWVRSPDSCQVRCPHLRRIGATPLQRRSQRAVGPGSQLGVSVTLEKAYPKLGACMGWHVPSALGRPAVSESSCWGGRQDRSLSAQLSQSHMRMHWQIRREGAQVVHLVARGSWRYVEDVMRVLARSCGGAAAPSAPAPAEGPPAQRSPAPSRPVEQAAGLGWLRSADRQATQLSARSSGLELGCYAARAAFHWPACSAAHLVCRKARPAAGPSCPSAQASQRQLPPTREPLQLGPCPTRLTE